jgi:hypothetical protein
MMKTQNSAKSYGISNLAITLFALAVFSLLGAFTASAALLTSPLPSYPHTILQYPNYAVAGIAVLTSFAAVHRLRPNS